MRNYPKLFVLPALILVLELLLSGFLTKGTDWELVRDLLLQRTAILEQTYFGELSSEEGERALCAVECHPLLRQDVELLRTYGNGGLDRVKDLRLLVLEPLHSYGGTKTYRACVEWTLLTGEGIEREPVFYYLVLEQVGSRSRISLLEPLV